MKLIIYLLFGLIFLFQKLVSADEIDKNSFIKAVDYYNCKIISYSLKDVANNQKDPTTINAIQNFNKFCDCDNLNEPVVFQKIITGLNTIPKDRISTTISLSYEIDSIKQNLIDYSISKDSIVNFILAVENRILLVNFFKKRKLDPNIKDFQNNLKNSLLQIVLLNVSEEKKTEIQNIATGNEQYEKNNNPSTMSSDFTIVLYSVSILLTLILFIYLRSSIVDINRKLNRSNDYTVLNREISELHIRINTIESNKTKEKSVSDLTNQINVLSNEINYLKSEISNKANPTKREIESYNEIKTDQQNKVQRKVELFLGNSFPNGSFDNTNVAFQYVTGVSIYKIVLRSETEGELFVCENEDTIDRLKFDVSILSSTCEALNSVLNFHQINNNSPGYVTLSDNIWVLKEKIKILYV